MEKPKFLNRSRAIPKSLRELQTEKLLRAFVFSVGISFLEKL
jgi:hypothetical protein